MPPLPALATPEPSPPLPLRKKHALRALSALVLALTLGGCRESSAPPVRIVLGPNPADEITLVPRASLAELIEITPAESTLLVTLTTGERNCETLTPPDASDVSLSLRVMLPGGAKLVTGAYPLLKPGPDADKPYVTSTVKLKGRRQELRPGGEVTLTQLDANPQGILEGNLKLEFAGDAEHPATRVSGHFMARFCRIDRLR